MMETLNKNTNMFHKLIDVYKAQNGGTCSKSLGFHKYRMRKDRRKFPNGRHVGVRSHRWEHWRQSEDKERMLYHFINLFLKLIRIFAMFNKGTKSLM